MAKKIKKNILGNNILLNLLAIVGVGILLIVLSLLIANIYTRHGQNVIVPHLQGLQIEEAQAILKAKGLKAEIVDSIYKKEAVPGSVIDQKPKAKNKVKEGRDIYLTVYSRNPQQIAIPGLVDFSSRQAMALLNSLGFTQISIEKVPAQYSGLVISVEYRGRKLVPDEQIPAGSPLRLIVGSGMEEDSLELNKEYIVSPENIRETNDSIRNSQPMRQSDIDESFF